MKILKKCMAVVFYLFLMVYLLQFDLRKLFNVRQILLVLFGAAILYLPNIQKKNGWHIDWQMFGKTALLASIIQTFMLLFILLSGTKDFEGLLYKAALECLPLLYGFCLWIIFEDKDEDKHKEEGSQEPVSYQEGEPQKPPAPSPEECSAILNGKGLSPREVEVALQVTRGMSNAQIAGELCISETTVKKHLSNIFAKLQINRREQIKEILYENI